MSESSKISKFTKRIRNREYRYLFKRIFKKGNYILYGGVQLVFRLSDIDKFEKLYAIVRKQCDHELIFAAKGDIDKLCEAFPESADSFRKRFAKGNTCFFTRKNGEITGHIWALESDSGVFNTNSLWRFKPDKLDGIWCFDGYVKPEHRMKGLFLYLMGSARSAFQNKGYITQYGETDDRNHMSLNTHLKVGYEVIWRVFFVSILGLKIYIARNPSTKARKISLRYSLNIDQHRL